MTEPVLELALFVFNLLYCNIFILECNVKIVFADKDETAYLNIVVI
jgi:hypothetical protein